MQKLGGEPFAQGHHLHWSLLCLGERGVEEGETETVFEVSDCINEGGVALLDDGVKVVPRLVLPQSLHSVPVLLLLSFLQLPQKNFEVSELPDDRFMKQKSDIFLVVQGLNLADVAFLSSFPVSGLPGIDSLQNAKATKVLKPDFNLLQPFEIILRNVSCFSNKDSQSL